MLVKRHIVGPCPQVFESVGLGFHPIMCISNKLLDHANAADTGTTLWEGVVWIKFGPRLSGIICPPGKMGHP